MILFKPDWVEFWTAEEAEKQLPDFVFKGPGIYHHMGDTLLVIPFSRPYDKVWHQRHEKGESFEFNVYNGRNIGDVINLLVNAPHRT